MEFEFIVILPKIKRIKMLDKRKWLDVKNKHLRHNNQCIICGTNHFLEVHHIKPINKFPELAYEPSNLVTLCRKGKNCHLVHGHLGNFNNHNQNILSLKKF